jgi:uncharacterized protein YbaR (Trm112 family)
MSLRWSSEEPEPVGRLGGTEELRRVVRSTRLATGTLACPECDAPVAPGPAPLRPADTLACPYCRHAAAAREFLSLAAPTRPARVAVHVREPVVRQRTRS